MGGTSHHAPCQREWPRSCEFVGLSRWIVPVGSVLQAPYPSLVPETASRYRLVRTIASGGMAHVYEAVAQGERGFTRRVAIKRILPQHANDESMRRMFFDEARVAGKLHHANVVQVLDFGVVDGDDFIVMEYVEGIDAARAVSMSRTRGMPEALALYVVSEVAHALAYAHALTDERGDALAIVHRDVSPHNLLFSWEGHVKLADFGIAIATGREEKTRTGVVKGKVSYMPPEQADGGALTGAADVYALAATLHALVSGSPPREQPRDALEIDPVLSPEARALIEECMASDAAARPAAEQIADRAGRLAAARLTRDARGALRDWLAPLAAIDRRQSALDDVMGLALVLSGDGRRFTVSREAAKPDAPSAEPEPSIHLPTRSYGRWAILVVVVLAIGGVASWVSMTGEQAPPPRDPIELPSAQVQAPPAEPPADPPLAIPEAPPIAPRTEIAAARAPRPRPPRVEPLAVPAPEPAPVAEAAPPAPAHVRIPRVGAAPERIEIDGRERGFTPAVVRVDSGDHRIVLRDGEGAVVLERNVTAEARHTPAAPLVLTR
jgi:tRNA A-37 threonylcarbamoyl transferase component Bud32